MMIVSLFTSRITLRALGVEDYGIYNVVGGIVIFLAFLNNTLAVSTQRFLNYEMGKSGGGNLEQVFSFALTSHYIIALFFLIIAETIVLWFVRHQLVIPPDRFEAALWVYHFSVFTFVVNIISTPYNAAIIACEKMGAYAYISIIEAGLKLAVSYILLVVTFDKLQMYAILLFIAALLIRLVYFFYCKWNISWITSRLRWNKKYMSKMFSFSGWGFLGAFSQMVSMQGVNVLINMFFNPVHNAARGIAMQLQAAVNTFSANFMTAVRPQIVKSYSDKEYPYSFALTCSAAKISYFLLLIIVVPLVINTEYVLLLWLKNVPEYAVVFTRLALIDILLGAMISPVAALSQASGKVKYYQLIISVSFILVFILTYVFYKNGYASYVTFIVSIIMTIVGTVGRVWELKYSVGFPIKYFLKEVVFRILLVSFCVFGLLVAYVYWWGSGSCANFITTTLISVSFSCLFIWFLGMKPNEKRLILEKIHLKR